MLRRGNFKLNEYLHEESELYDLDSDPGEFENLASDPGHRIILEDLRERLHSRWDPHRIESQVLASQAKRRFLKPYLYRYLYDD